MLFNPTITRLLNGTTDFGKISPKKLETMKQNLDAFMGRIDSVKDSLASLKGQIDTAYALREQIKKKVGRPQKH